MHIPDGLMWPPILVVGWVIGVSATFCAVRRASYSMTSGRVPLLSLLAAGIFMAQMLNFPIGGGTTGHLVGAALATILLGLAPGILVIVIILLVQALLFGDGGVTALGLNMLNMAVVGCGVSHLVYSAAPLRLKRPAVFAAAWFAVFIGAGVCALELGVSYAASNGLFGIPFGIALPAMLGYHAVIGIGEGVLTLGIMAYLHQVLPGVFETSEARPGRAVT